MNNIMHLFVFKLIHDVKYAKAHCPVFSSRFLVCSYVYLRCKICLSALCPSLVPILLPVFKLIHDVKNAKAHWSES
jgi:hypothetical protein